MFTQPFTPQSFTTFGDVLKYLRRRQRLTQLELSIAVGYSEAQISRLEKNQRLPDLTAVKALFIPVLRLENEPEIIKHFLELAESARQEDAPAPGIPPYKGLLYFDEPDADLFFGREALTARLTEHVIGLARGSSSHFLAVVGASGSGKSSLVRAGLAVALKRAGWYVWVFTPTAQPLKMLTSNLNVLRTKASGQTLMIVDQFEEVFTLCRDEIERIAFIEKLLTLATVTSGTSSITGDGNTSVVIALRADFYSHLAQYPLLRQAVAAEQLYIGQMTAEELRRAIEEPAKCGGWEFEPGLVDVLLQDIGVHGSQEPEPGALPLLSHALLATWERRRGRVFTLDGYHASGGVRGAIAETAESVFTDQLNQKQQELAHDVFLRLTELGEGTEDTRRRAALNELVRQSEEATQLRVVLNTLAEARLITLSEDSAEVAHEALIREWQRLHEWLTQDREGLKLHRHLTDFAREWETLGRDTGALYRGARLAQVREWAAANEERMNESERKFLKASVDQEEHEALEREAQRQRELEAAQNLAMAEKARADEQIRSANRLKLHNRIISAVGSMGLIVALLAGLFGVQARNNLQAAQANLMHAESLRLAAEATGVLAESGDPQTAVLLSIRALQRDYSIQADAALASALSGLHNRQILQGYTGWEPVYSVRFSPDGKFALIGSQDGIARLWDLHSGEVVRRFAGHRGGISAVAYSPDGKYILTGGNDGTVRLWDAATGEQLRLFSSISGGITAVDFSPDEQFVLSAGAGNIARLWDLKTGRELQSFSGHSALISDASFSPDGCFVLTASYDRTARLWDVASGALIRTFSEDTERDRLTSAALSPDGKYLVTSSTDRTVRLWNAKTGQAICTCIGHADSVNDVAFSPDGKYVITGAEDRTSRVWDAHNCQEIQRFVGLEDSVKSVTFSPDGQLVLAGVGNTGRLWAAPTANPLRTFISRSPHIDTLTRAPEGTWVTTRGSVNSVAFSSEGSFVLTGDDDGMAYLWDASTGAEFRDFVGHTGPIYEVAFSSDGKYVLTVSLSDKTARTWNLETGRQVQAVRIFPGYILSLAISRDEISSLAFSLDGKWILTGSPDVVQLWDAATAQLLRDYYKENPNFGRVSVVAFSPDGQSGLSAAFDYVARLWDLKTGAEIRSFSGHVDLISDATFSYDGRYVLTGSLDRTARLWDAASSELIRTFTDHASRVTSVAFAPDGKTILTGHDDNKARLWDVNSGEQLREFTGHTFWINSVAFSPDGRYVLTGSADGTARLWDTDYHDTIRFACSLLWRDFTEKERVEYGIPDNNPTCPEG